MIELGELGRQHKMGKGMMRDDEGSPATLFIDKQLENDIPE